MLWRQGGNAKPPGRLCNKYYFQDRAQSQSLGWVDTMANMLPLCPPAGVSCEKAWKNMIFTPAGKNLFMNHWNFHVIYCCQSLIYKSRLRQFASRIRENWISDFKVMEGLIHSPKYHSHPRYSFTYYIIFLLAFYHNLYLSPTRC